MRALITDKHLLEMMWNRFPEIMRRGIEQPAQRTWVGLTDEEWQDFSDRYGLIIWGPFKREIEAKLKEKNSGD